MLHQEYIKEVQLLFKVHEAVPLIIVALHLVLHHLLRGVEYLQLHLVATVLEHIVHQDNL